MKTGYSGRVIFLASLSRIFCLSLAILSSVGSRLDNQRNTIIFGPDPQPAWLYDFVSPLTQWDGIHFLNIATRGYDSILSHAFFPGLPLVMRILGLPFQSLFANPTLLLSLAGVIFVQFSFVLGALGLYRLSTSVLSSSSMGYQATLFYIFPASNIFMSAVYTESPFSMLTFWALYWLQVRQKLWIATILFAAAGLFRSNGILAIAFILHGCLADRKGKFERIVSACLVYLPYYLYSWWSYNLYCHPALTAARHDWCDSFSSIYPFIQKRFWNVAPFAYWKSTNIPYFLLMLPALIVSVYGISSVLRDRKRLIFSLLRREQTIPERLRAFLSFAEIWEAPYVVQMGILTLFTIFVANCQILTRILTSCPLFFWSLCRLYTRASERMQSLILSFQLGYFLVGPVVFSNGFNWT